MNKHHVNTQLPIIKIEFLQRTLNKYSENSTNNKETGKKKKVYAREIKVDYSDPAL